MNERIRELVSVYHQEGSAAPEQPRACVALLGKRQAGLRPLLSSVEPPYGRLLDAVAVSAELFVFELCAAP